MRLFAILLVLFLGAAVFAQSKGAGMCEFNQPPTLERQAFNTSPEYLDLCTYSFKQDDNLYVLSYDPTEDYRDNNILYDNETKTRNVYLYRQVGDKWVKASNIVKNDYWSSSGEYDIYYPTRRDLNGLIRNIGNSEIKTQSNGKVTMEVLSFYGDKYHNDFQHRWDEYECTPNGNGNYTVRIISQVFRPNQ